MPLEIVSYGDTIDYDVNLFKDKIETIVLNSRPSFSKQEYIDTTIEFIKKYSYKELQARTVYSGLNIGEFSSTQRKIYKKLKTKTAQEQMESEFSVIHRDYLFNQEDVLIQLYIDTTIEYIQKYGYQSIKSTTVYNDFNIGEFRSTQRKKYKRLESTREKNKMKKIFNIIHNDYLLNGLYVSRRNHIEATIDYISKNGYDSLSNKTQHNGFNIGNFRANQRKKYKELKSSKEKEILLDEFSVIHKDYLSVISRTVP